MSDSWNIQQDDVCSLCGEFLLDGDRPLTLVESGRMDPMKKDPSFLKFVPDHMDGDEDAMEDIFHTECVVAQAIEEGWAGGNPGQCDACGEIFLRDIPRWAFRLRSGDVGYDRIFAIDPAPDNLAILCVDCFKLCLGDVEDEV